MPAPDAEAPARVLVVEDEPEFAELLSVWLTARGWDALLAPDGAEALRRFDAEQPDVVLLDVSLPQLDGWQVLARIRAVSDTPVLMVTARGAEAERLRGLGGGADDYITKPFGFPELVARVEVALRRSSRARGPGAAPLRRGEVVIDRGTHRVLIGSQEVHLSPTEFRLLAFLAERSSVVVRHRELLAGVWGPGYEHEHHLLQVTVRNLRAKLAAAAPGRYVATVYGVGYRFQALMVHPEERAAGALPRRAEAEGDPRDGRPSS